MKKINTIDFQPYTYYNIHTELTRYRPLRLLSVSPDKTVISFKTKDGYIETFRYDPTAETTVTLSTALDIKFK